MYTSVCSLTGITCQFCGAVPLLMAIKSGPRLHRLLRLHSMLAHEFIPQWYAPGAALAYGGPCTTCNRQHWLRCTPEAATAAKQLVQRLMVEGRLDYESPTRDPRFALDMLLTHGPGRMLGVLVAVDGHRNKHLLKAFSGQITESWHIPGWVGPIGQLINTSEVYINNRQVIETLSYRINQLGKVIQQQAPGPVETSLEQRQKRQRRPTHQSGPAVPLSLKFALEQQQLLKQRRKNISHHLLKQIQHSYLTQDFQGCSISLLDVYLNFIELYNQNLPVTNAGSFRGMLAGTGDCCAPKLLHAAYAARLIPIGLAEIWCGSGPGTATKAKQGRQLPVSGLDPSSSRQHMQLYGMCEKCSAIMGTMLCGQCPDIDPLDGLLH